MQIKVGKEEQNVCTVGDVLVGECCWILGELYMLCCVDAEKLFTLLGDTRALVVRLKDGTIDNVSFATKCVPVDGHIEVDHDGE